MSPRSVVAALVPGDVVRAAAAVSVVVAAVRLEVVAVALFLLVLGGVMVPRALGVAAPLDVAYCGALLVAAWAAQLEWYRAVPWLDLPVHAACTGLIAAVAFVALARVHAVPEPGPAGSGGSPLGVVVTTTGLGALVAVLWEVGEWAGHTYLDDRIGVGYTDTVVDLAAGVAGSAVAGLALARAAARPGGRP